MTKLKKSALIGGALCAGLISLAAYAQTRSEPSPRPDPQALQEKLRAAAETRPRLRPPPVGRPAQRVVRSRINWAEAKEIIEATRQRDARSQATTAAVIQRGPGVRAMSPRQLKNVRPPEVDRVLMPVLIPSAPGIAETVQVFGQPNAYSAIARITDGPSLRISGSRNKVVVGDLRSARERITAMRKREAMLPGMDTPYLISRSDSSTDISFSKFGCGYVLSLMCDDPDDPRCAEDDYIVDLASNLVLLNENAGDDQ